jgi:hypothetical protein
MSCAFNGPVPTNGAYEPFGLTSAEIGLVAANKIVANFTAIDQPILPAGTTCAAFSIHSRPALAAAAKRLPTATAAAIIKAS